MVSKLNNKNFSDGRFFPVVPLELGISRRISKKFETALMGYSVALGKLILEKNLKSKISWHCLFKCNTIKLKLLELEFMKCLFKDVTLLAIFV
jgi:hypothetical protein